ncbi:efflux RND transporter periplasmic adaptor subunit [Robertkochia solimangrovi]|uniref:efflux RND transporter periplasmic adaptor subunit n=1 Tax=Robertkochia solimangrovi TaxID=2213046 RepID=UPI00117E5DE3|nr:efflux RND transporter periplasmic adaptor subunit [Robertkochia solimangrovi]TRZ41277.1 efflux transporter periplasmic adaptor subunit [Robertkochia solimangrovi]
MKIKNLFYLLIVLAVLTLVGYRIFKNASESPKAAAGGGRSEVRVKGMILKPQPFDDNLSLTGTLEANEQVEIRSEISGMVESINFTEGSKVQKGQLLLKINDQELRAQYSKVKTAERLESENERRAKLLLEKNAISQEEYDLAQANYQSAKAESELVSAQLAKTSIRAPFSGKLGLRNISVGTYVTPTTTITKLVNTQQLKLTFSIPEKYAATMDREGFVTFRAPNSEIQHKAKIYAIEPEVDIQTRTLKLRAIVDNDDSGIYPGMFVNVALPLSTVEDALMVPSEALIPIQNGKVIFVYKDGIAKEVKVQTETRTDRMVRVISGLKPGDTILTYGVMALTDGIPVSVSIEE